MSIKIEKFYLPYNDQQVQALLTLPEGPSLKAMAIFTHGYTSHKGSILNWAIRLAELGVPALIYDLPGHYLGSYSEVHSFEYFQQKAHLLFEKAYHFMRNHNQLAGSKDSATKIILGGHSLGALLSLKAMELECFSHHQELIAIAVGLGLPPKGITHIFESPFYKSTMDARAQLVSAELSPNNIFPWIKREKENITISEKRIHLISGEDDIIVGKEGTQRFADILEAHGNTVSIQRPASLAHHLPENAAPHIKSWLKKNHFLS